jgi:carbonic anhydrase
MGHEGWGAVDAAIGRKLYGARQRIRIEVPLENIMPALDDLDASQAHEALLHAAVEANVRHTIQALLDSPEVQARLAAGDMKLIGAVYDLESGRARFLE